MPDVTITEFANAIRAEMRAEMRVHRTEVEGALKDVKTQQLRARRENRDRHNELVRAIAELRDLVEGQAKTVTELATTRAAWARRAQLITRALTSTPGLVGTVSAIAGAVAAAIALF
jgi:thiamine pyrophosphate-dependent acetolactate synthase large subunit-like protein